MGQSVPRDGPQQETGGKFRQESNQDKIGRAKFRVEKQEAKLGKAQDRLAKQKPPRKKGLLYIGAQGPKVARSRTHYNKEIEK